MDESVDSDHIDQNSNRNYISKYADWNSDSYNLFNHFQPEIFFSAQP